MVSCFTLQAQWVQIGEDINGEDSLDRTGWSVDLSGDGSILAVGTTGFINRGGVNVYQNSNDNWIQIGQSIIGDSEADFFGYSLCLNEEGNIIAISGTLDDDNGNASGHVRVFQNNNDSWVQIGQDIDGENEHDTFGTSVSISDSGTIVAVGAAFNDDNGSDSGNVRVFNNENGVWTQLGQKILGESSNDYFGKSVNLNGEGSILAIGAHGANGTGNVRVFKYENDSWQQIGQNINGENSDDNFGEAISMNQSGSIIAIGSSSNGIIYNGKVVVFENINDVWVQKGENIEGTTNFEGLGISVEVNSEGNILAIGSVGGDGTSENLGFVGVYQYNNDNWFLIDSVIEGEQTESFFGRALSINNEGTILAIGDSKNNENDLSSGEVKVFENNFLSIEENNKISLKIYPNPVSEVLRISMTDYITFNHATIYSVLGEKLMVTSEKNIDFSNLSEGMYFVEIDTEQGTISKKILKK